MVFAVPAVTFMIGKRARHGNGGGFVVQGHNIGRGDDLRLGGLVQEREDGLETVSI